MKPKTKIRKAPTRNLLADKALRAEASPHEHKRKTFSLLDLLSKPDVWTAIGSIGLLVTAVYAAFFSPFSKVVETQLRQDNNSLKQQQETVTASLLTAEEQLNTLEIDLTKKENELIAMTDAVSTAKTKLANLDSELALKDITLGDLDVELTRLTGQISNANLNFKEAYKEYYLSLSSASTADRRLPYYTVRRINGAIRRVNGAATGPGVPNPFSSEEFRKYTEDAYRELQTYFGRIEADLSNDAQRRAYEELHQDFEKRCGSPDKVHEIAEKLLLDLDIDPEGIGTEILSLLGHAEKYCLGIED